MTHPKTLTSCDRETFVSQFHRLQDHLSVGSVQAARIVFDWESVLQTPCHGRLMRLVQEGDGDVPALHRIVGDGVEPVEEAIVGRNRTTFQRHIVELFQAVLTHHAIHSATA